MKVSTLVPTAVAAALASQLAYAEPKPAKVQGAPVNVTALAPRLQSTAKLAYRCYTNQRGCSGNAVFGPQSRPVSYRIRYANGGESNFVFFNSGETATYSVRYGDTYQSEWGTAGVPVGNPSYFIGVN